MASLILKPLSLFVHSIIFALSWLSFNLTRLGQRLLLRVLAAGPVPKHVAFVMDGNRRYARKNGKPVHEGHGDGYFALRRVLEICFRLNIHCVSVYAFAIDNFKRPREEVDALMHLTESKLLELCAHGNMLDEYGVRLNVIGRVELFPKSVQAAVRKAEDMTRENSRSILNICMPYSSRDEMTTAIEKSVREALSAKAVDDDWFPSDPIESINEEKINSNLMSIERMSPPLNILIRTSGVTRFSDFMLWQCCENVQLHFSETYWPEFGLFDFVPIILQWQRSVWSRRNEVCTQINTRMET